MRHVRLPLLIAVAAVIAAALAPSASASRRATGDELAAMTSGMSEPARCFRGTVSTVDPAWGALRPTRQPGCGPANGVLGMQREDGEWTIVLNDGEDPSRPCSDVDVPQRPAVDLRLCTAPSRKVYAGIFGRWESKPRSLPWGAHAFVDKIHWRSWGGATAVGRGVFDYADRYDRFKIAVRVTLERRRVCENRRIYLSWRIAAVRSGDAHKIRYLRGPNVFDCPNGW